MVTYIPISTLRSFTFSYRFVIDISVDYPYKFVINDPNLEYFHVKGRISNNLVVKSLTTMINTHLDHRETIVNADRVHLVHDEIFAILR